MPSYACSAGAARWDHLIVGVETPLISDELKPPYKDASRWRESEPMRRLRWRWISHVFTSANKSQQRFCPSVHAGGERSSVAANVVYSLADISADS